MAIIESELKMTDLIDVESLQKYRMRFRICRESHL